MASYIRNHTLFSLLVHTVTGLVYDADDKITLEGKLTATYSDRSTTDSVFGTYLWDKANTSCVSNYVSLAVMTGFLHQPIGDSGNKPIVLIEDSGHALFLI